MVFSLYYKTRVSMRKVEFLEERLNFMISGGRPKAQATFYCFTDVEVRKHGDQRGLDTPVVHAVNYENSLLEHLLYSVYIHKMYKKQTK